MSRCVILSAGPVRDADALRDLLRADDAFVVADGGQRLALALGITPLAIVADFDSSCFGDLPDAVARIRLPEKKDCTDTAAAVEYALQHGFDEFLLLGCTGGRLDHQYAATQLLVQLAKRGISATIADDQNRIMAAVSSPIVMQPMDGWSLSLFAFGEAVRGLSVRGAVYELDAYDLFPDDPLCVSNSVTDTPCTITFSSGVLLIYRAKD